eukprot:6249986-Amphidinium_carterae.1
MPTPAALYAESHNTLFGSGDSPAQFAFEGGRQSRMPHSHCGSTTVFTTLKTVYTVAIPPRRPVKLMPPSREVI